MFFRNLILFRIPASLVESCRPPDDPDDCHEFERALVEQALKPVGAMEKASYGFVSPYGRDQDQFTQMLVHTTGAAWLTLGSEEKLITAAVIAKEVHERMKKASERMGLQISAKQRRAFREEVIADMLPKAFIEAKRADAYIDWDRQFIAVDTSSRKLAESLISMIRHATGSFPALPINAEVSPRAILTGWLAGEPLPEGFALGEECELRAPAQYGGIVKCQRVDLGDEDITKHLESGMQCTRLALTFDEHVSFVIGDDMVLRKIKFLDGALEKMEDQDTAKQELNARLALMTGTLGRVFDALEAAFKISPAQDAPEPAPQRRRRRGKALDGIESVTITVGNHAPVKLTAEQFANLPEAAAEFGDMYRLAVGIVVDNGNASISHLQRRLKIGYNRAARLIEVMETAGVVSPPAHNGERTVLQKGDFS